MPSLAGTVRPIEPEDTASLRRQETTLILLNLGVLAALTLVHLGFIGTLGPPPRPLLLVFALRFVEQTAVLAWWQTRVEPLSSSALSTWAHASVWTGVAFAAVVMGIASHEDSHYQILLILPLLSAAFRFSMPLVVGIAFLAAGISIGQVWLAARGRATVVPGEYFEAVTMSLIYLVVGPMVTLLVRVLHERDVELRARAVALSQARERLMIEEKFAAVGRLASAVAHEVRNPVAMIASSLATAIRPQTPEAVRQELFGIAEREAQRLERVTGDFLAYARPRPIDARVLPLAVALGHTADLVRSRAEERQLTVRVVDAPEVTAAFDPTQLHQALLNLAMNAMEATPPGGEVTLAAWPHRGGVVFRVGNTGAAIAADVVDRLFEPFFTSRPTGTGLGLPIARAIARAHGGDLVLAVNDATGVAFDLHLPSQLAGDHARSGD